MYTVSPEYLSALATSHTIITNIRVSKGGKTVYSNLPFESGSITVDFSATARRKISLTVPPSLAVDNYIDKKITEIVTTGGHQLHVTMGLVFPNGSIEWVPVGVFRVDTRPDVDTSGAQATITGVSRESFIADAKFLTPRTITGKSATAVIVDLIREALPKAEISVQTQKVVRVPAFIVEQERAEAITKVAQSISCVWYCDGEGRFIVKDAPALTSTPVWTIRTGTGGTLVSATSSQSRDGVFNAVVVRGESPSGDYIPLQGVVYDDAASSLTRWGDPDSGAFGKVPTFIDNPAISSVPQAHEVGRAELAKRVGIASGMDLTSVPNVALEAGDTILVIPDQAPAGLNARKHIIDSMTIPLVAGGDFSIRTRDVRAND